MPPFPRRKCERRIWSRWIERCSATDSRCTAESTNERACHGRKAEGGAVYYDAQSLAKKL